VPLNVLLRRHPTLAARCRQVGLIIDPREIISRLAVVIVVGDWHCCVTNAGYDLPLSAALSSRFPRNG